MAGYGGPCAPRAAGRRTRNLTARGAPGPPFAPLRSSRDRPACIDLDLEQEIGAADVAVHRDEGHALQIARGAPRLEIRFEERMFEVGNRARHVAKLHPA